MGGCNTAGSDNIRTGTQYVWNDDIPGGDRSSNGNIAKYLHDRGNFLFRNRAGCFDRQRKIAAGNRNHSSNHTQRFRTFLLRIDSTTRTGIAGNRNKTSIRSERNCHTAADWTIDTSNYFIHCFFHLQF